MIASLLCLQNGYGNVPWFQTKKTPRCFVPNTYANNLFYEGMICIECLSVDPFLLNPLLSFNNNPATLTIIIVLQLFRYLYTVSVKKRPCYFRLGPVNPGITDNSTADLQVHDKARPEYAMLFDQNSVSIIQISDFLTKHLLDKSDTHGSLNTINDRFQDNHSR